MSKLLFITLNDHVPWGGSEELWSRTALTLVKDNYVTIVKKQWEKEQDCITEIIKLGGKLIYKPKPKKTVFYKLKSKLTNVTFNKNDLNFVTDISTYDLAILSAGNHVNHKIVEYTSFLKQHGVEYVIAVQLATSLRNLHDNQIEKLKTAYNNAIGIGCLSSKNQDVLETQLGLSLDNVFRINNPFNYKQTYLYPKVNEVFHVACVAAYTMFHKGQEMLLKVLSQDKWKERNICFNLYGKGVNENHFKSLIKLYGLEHLVKLKGHIGNKEEIWSVNHACILPSRMEGQSLAMLEAMSFGRMVISTAVGGADELIEHGKTGFLAKAPTIALLDDALEQAWEKRDCWLDMGKASRDKLFEVITEDPVEKFKKEIKKILQ